MVIITAEDQLEPLVVITESMLYMTEYLYSKEYCLHNNHKNLSGEIFILRT